MTNEKAELNQVKNELCTSIFKNNILTKEAYTYVWIEIIATKEHKKSINYSSSR